MGDLGGLQNPSKFRARAFSPTEEARFFEFMCESFVVPGLTIAANPVRVLGYGVPVDAPLLPAYGEAQLSCYLDNAGMVQGFFSRWQQSVINYNYEPGGATAGTMNGAYPFQVSYEEDYAGRIIVDTFDQAGEHIRELILHAAWPRSIGQIQHSWGDRDKVTLLPVVLAYRSWTSNDIEENTGGVPTGS